MNNELIPEWTRPDRIALVWPEHLPSEVGSKLKGYYKALIDLLVENEVSVMLLYRESTDYDHLIRLFNVKYVNPIHLPEISDIWIRDFGPLFLKDHDSIKPVRFRYDPSYSKTKNEKVWAASNDSAGYQLTKQMPVKIELEGNELILDGGNFIHNGLGTAIVTNRIISDNEHLFEHEIREILKEKLGIEKLHIIPSEPGDDTGHIDGLVRFLDPETLLVGQYPEHFPEGRKFTDKIATFLSHQGFSVYRMPNTIPQNGKYPVSGKLQGDGTFENAAGNYLNFLRAGNKFFIPWYNTDDDLNALDALKKASFEGREFSEFIQVRSDATPLAEYGGVINCITLPVYSEIK